MLVLTRKVQEQIQIGATITVTVLKTSGKTVKLGISGPPEVPMCGRNWLRSPASVPGSRRLPLCPRQRPGMSWKEESDHVDNHC